MLKTILIALLDKHYIMDKDKTETYFEIIGADGTGETVALSHIIKQKGLNKEDVVVLVPNDFQDKGALTERLNLLPKGTIVIIENIDEVVK